MRIYLFFVFFFVLFLSGCVLEKGQISPYVYSGTNEALSFHKDRFLKDVTVVAHVGVPKEETYNSLAGFRLAKKYGADAIEFDVSLTKDRQHIVMHGPDMSYSTSCPLSKEAVSHHTLLEIRNVCTLNNGEKIRTVEEMLLEVKDLFPLIFVEIKVYDSADIAFHVSDVSRIVKKLHMESQVVLSSYDQNLSYELMQNTGVILGWDTYTPKEFYKLSDTNLSFFLSDFRVLDKDLISFVHSSTDKLLVAYTAMNLDQFLSLYNSGVRIIYTDDIKNTMLYVLSGTKN